MVCLLFLCWVVKSCFWYRGWDWCKTDLLRGARYRSRGQIMLRRGNRCWSRREAAVSIRGEQSWRGDGRGQVRTRGRDRLRRQVRWRRGIAVTRRRDICLMMGDRWRHRDGRRLSHGRWWTPLRWLQRRRARRC